MRNRSFIRRSRSPLALKALSSRLSLTEHRLPPVQVTTRWGFAQAVFSYSSPAIQVFTMAWQKRINPLIFSNLQQGEVANLVRKYGYPARQIPPCYNGKLHANAC